MIIGRRAIAVGLSLLTHLILLLALLPHATKPQIEPGVMSASLISGEGAESTPPAEETAKPPSERLPDEVAVKPDIEPLPLADAALQPDLTAEPAAIGDAVGAQVASAAAVVATDGDRCALGAWLQAALQDDPAALSALASVPRSARSVANALMLWNGTWPPPPANAGPGLAQLRAVIVAGISAAPASCQNEPINGPILISVGEQADGTVLAVGSGQWRWRDLLPQSQNLK